LESLSKWKSNPARSIRDVYAINQGVNKQEDYRNNKQLSEVAKEFIIHSVNGPSNQKTAKEEGAMFNQVDHSATTSLESKITARTVHRKGTDGREYSA